MRKLEQIKNDLQSGKRTDYEAIALEARTIFNDFKQTLPPQSRSPFPTNTETYIAKLVFNWENLCMQIQRDCKDREVLMRDLEKRGIWRK